MGSGEYRLYLERHDPAHDTWPAPPPPPSESLPTVPLEDQGDASDCEQEAAGCRG